MSLLQYYERFNSIAETEDSIDVKIGVRKLIKDFATQSSAIDTADEIYCGISFLRGGIRDNYLKLLEELHNDYLLCNYQFPKSLYEAYTLMSDWKRDTHRYGGSAGGGGADTQESHSLK